MFQQLAGVNTAMYYGPEVMMQAGFGSNENKSAILVSTLPLAIVNFLGSIIVLFFIDNLGRRWILLRTLPFTSFFIALVGLGM